MTVGVVCCCCCFLYIFSLALLFVACCLVLLLAVVVVISCCSCVRGLVFDTLRRCVRRLLVGVAASWSFVCVRVFVRCC